MNTHEAFSECQDVLGDEPLRQGDVFSWLRESSDPWEQCGIVVTADCDLAHAKHRGVLSYVPVLPLYDYLALFYLPSQIRRIGQQLYEELAAKLRRFQEEHRPEFPSELSTDALVVWLESADPDAILDEIGVPPGRDRDRFIQLVDAWSACNEPLDGQPFTQQFEALQGGRCLKAKGDQAAKLWNEIRGHIESLPGDGFFLSGVSSTQRSGHVAYLRVIREINEDEIALRASDLRRDTVKARRTSRLRSPYIYRLTQQLAAVFTAIGLPSQYEASRADILSAWEAPDEEEKQ